MEKRNRIIYWIFTIWLCLGMVSTGIVQLLQLEAEVENMNSLGYPLYLLTMIGIWKLLGVIVILAPGLLILKEWAYAGFFFVMSGALISHLAMAHPFSQVFPPLLLLVLTVISWYFRPPNRKLERVAEDTNTRK